MNLKSSNFFTITVLLTPLIFNLFGANIFELPKIQFLTITTAITLIILALSFLKKGKIAILYDKTTLIFLSLWLISLTLSTIFSIAPGISFWGGYDRLQGLISHLIYLANFIIFLHLFQHEENQNLFLKGLLAVATIISIHAILQQFNIFTFFSYALAEFSHRSFATLGHPTALGQFLIFPIWLSLYFLATSNKKTLPLLSTILLLTALFTTQNRASLLGLSLGILFFLIFHPHIKRPYKYLAAALSLGTLTIFVTIFAHSLRSLFTRFYLWEGTIQLFPQYPFFGSGLETFRYTFQQVANPALYGFEKLYEIADRAHNHYLDISSTQGLIGLSVYLSIILGLFLLFFRQKQRTPKLLIFYSAFLSILISDFFSFPLTVHYLVLVAMIALILQNTVSMKKTVCLRRPLAIITAVFVIILSAFATRQAVKVISADILFINGQKNISNLHFQDGINNLRTATSLSPHQADIYYNLAESLSTIGNTKSDQSFLFEAANYLEKAGRVDNKSFIYYLLSGRLASNLGGFESSEALFKQGIKLAPNNPLLLREMGEMYFSAGQYEKCIETMEKYLALLPDYWQWLPNLKNMSYEDQEKHRLFVKHIPDFGQIFASLSKSYKMLGNMEKANYYGQFSTYL